MAQRELKKFPVFNTDEEAERFVETADLSEYDFSDMKPTHFVFDAEATELNVQLPATLVAAVRNKAIELGVPYERLVRDALEKAVGE